MTADNEVVRLEIPSSPKYVGVARRALEAIAVNMSLTQQQIDDLKLAVGEACTNAVKYTKPGTRSVCVLYRVTPGCIQIEIRNQSNGFDGRNLDLPAGRCDGLRIDGRGIYIIKQCVDDLNIGCEDGVTVVTMTKQLRGRA